MARGTATETAGGAVLTATLPAVPISAATRTQIGPTPPVPSPSFPAVILPTAAATVGQFAFASDRSGIPQIYISDVSGDEPLPVTNLPDGACQPSWSPDGARLVFVSPCHVSPEGRPLDISEGPTADTALYTINADGSNLVALPTVPGGDSEPAWSPDGKRIVFTSLRDGRPLIYVLDLMDQSVKRLTEPSADFAAARQPAWSPFGNQIRVCEEAG